MKPEFIDQIATWLSATDIAVLELSGPLDSLRLVREDGAFKATSQASAAAGHDHYTVTAQSPGIFLHHHPLHARSMVQPGEFVTAGRTLGLLQIGALLLPVKAHCSGRVKGLWVAHGTPVGFGAALVELDRSKRHAP